MTATERAREMLKRSSGADYSGVCHETGLAMSSVIVLASRMRRDGLLPRLAKRRFEYTATHMQTGVVVKFKSMYSAEKSGFTAACIRNMFNKGRSEYCGYSWERVEIVEQ